MSFCCQQTRLRWVLLIYLDCLLRGRAQIHTGNKPHPYLCQISLKLEPGYWAQRLRLKVREFCVDVRHCSRFLRLSCWFYTLFSGSTTGTIPTFFGSASTQPSAGGLFSNALPSASGNRFSCVTPASGAGGLFGTSTGQVNVGATGSGGLLQGSGSLFSGLGSVSSTPMFNIFGGSKSGATGLSNTSPSAPGGAEAPKMGTLFGPALTTGSLAPSSTVTQSSSTPGELMISKSSVQKLVFLG